MRMRPHASILIAGLLSIATSAFAEGPPVQPAAHKGDGWAIAAPSDWKPFAGARPPIVLYLVGDGRAGVPLLDGCLSPIKAGLQVEVIPAKGRTLQARIDRDLKEFDPAESLFQTLEAPKSEKVTLADQTNAQLMTVEFVRKENGRLSIYRKLYCENAKGDHVIATAFITSSRPARKFMHATGLPEMLRANLMSLVLDTEKLDLKSLDKLYVAYDWSQVAASQQIGEANALLEAGKFEESIPAFRTALKAQPSNSSGHNGLAWALLHLPAPTADDLKESVVEARMAVEQTEELDFNSLDTLALSLLRTGQRDEALKTIKKAIAIAPQHKELQQRLTEIQRSPAK